MADAMDSSGFAKPKSDTWKPGKPGDAFKGVYVSSKPFEGQYGQTSIYTFKAIGGSYHDMDENGVAEEAETPIVAGQMYGIFGRKTIAEDMEQAKPGQQVIIRFTDVRKPKSGGKPYKFVECLLGPMEVVKDGLDKVNDAF